MSHKMLLVFCDGTGADGNITDPDTSSGDKASFMDDANVLFAGAAERTSTSSHSGLKAALPGQTRVKGSPRSLHATNVLRLSRAVCSYSEDKQKRQIVFYQSGVGAEADFHGEPVASDFLLEIYGTAVASKIRDAYAFIAQNFEAGDEVCLFGFSRGAYSVRKLAGLIDRIGLLPRRDLGLFFQLWKELADGKDPQIPKDTRRTSIKCVGVWDTVGSVSGAIDALSIKDKSLQPTIEIALHALSLHENREVFLPTLWEVPKGGLAANQVLKQIWFPGAHSDIGGGYKRHELADIALFWMAGEIESFINIDTDFLMHFEQKMPDSWGASQPHNAYEELDFYEKWPIGTETRLESGQITQLSIFHESNTYTPQDLTDPRHMITLAKLKQEFGSEWKAHYAPLNTFEKYCKDHWGPLVGGPIMSPIFDDPNILFGSDESTDHTAAGSGAKV